MTVDNAYQLINYIANKNINGSVKPTQFNTIINAAQNEYFSFLLGQFQTYQPQLPKARVSYGQNEVVRQRLAPLIYGPVSIAPDGQGFFQYPPDYQQVDAMTDGNGKRIRWCPQDKFFSVYGSVIDPFATNPFYMIEQSGLRFYPATVGSARMYYVQKPPQIFWNSTPDANGRAVYTPSGSKDPVWTEADMMEIIGRALRMIGVNLQSPMIAQYASEIKAGGQ